MTGLSALYVRSLRTTTGAVALVALYAAIALLVVAVTVTLSGTLALRPLHEADPLSAGVGATLGVSGCLAAVVVGGLAFTVLLGSPLTRDQATGRVVAEVASPAGARRAWLARALALWTVAALASWAGGMVAVVVMRQVWAPGYPWVALDPAFLLTGLVLTPALWLGVALTVTAVGLTAGAMQGSVVANLVYVGATATLGRLAGAGVPPPTYALVVAIVAAVMVVAGVACALLVTRERTVLACR